MQASRRYRAAMGVALALAGLAVLADRVVLLWGTAAVAGPLLARQLAVRRRADRVLAGCSAGYALERDRVRADAPVAVTLQVDLETPTDHPVTVRASRPVGATGDGGPTLRLDPGEREAATTVEWAFPMAGRYALPAPRLRLDDRAGFLAVDAEVATTTATIEVEPRTPRRVHVGRGGRLAAATYGDHRSGRAGAGTVPAEVRQYVAGDDVRHIDWAATARLADVYVREHDAETDRTTSIVVDAGAGMATGPAGETQLDYAVHVALTLVDVAAGHRDPVGLVTVGDDEALRWDPPAAERAHYASVRARLRGLEPAAEAGAARRGGAPGQRAALLADGSPFAEQLEPLLGPDRRVRAGVARDPLVAAARGPFRRRGGTVWTAILTDDAEPARVIEAARAARRGDDLVSVFLLPDVLFDPGGLGDLEAAYDRYRAFESFRRRLDRLERVTAVEVGPADRVEAVLGDRRRGAGGRR